MSAKIMLLAAAVLGSAAYAEVAIAGKADRPCSEAYGKTPYFVDAKTKWTYFKDVVAEIDESDGAIRVAFQTRSKMFELPANADKAFLDALKASLASSTPIHVTVDASGGTAAPKPGAIASTGKLDRIQWASGEKQHESCR